MPAANQNEISAWLEQARQQSTKLLCLLILLQTALAATMSKQTSGDGATECRAAGKLLPLGPDAVVVGNAAGAANHPMTRKLECGNETAELVYDPARQGLAFSVSSDSSPAPQAPLPGTRKVRLLRPLLERLFRDEGGISTYSFVFGPYPEMNARMRDAAMRSKDWDSVRGRPMSGSTSQFVKKSLNEERLYPELARVWQDLGYRLHVSDVEEVLVAPLKPADSTTGSAEPRVPASALIYFTAEKTAP